MRYNYRCNNEECTSYDVVVSVEKPMSESSKIELCRKCNSVLTRQYSVPSIGTSDGFKK